MMPPDTIMIIIMIKRNKHVNLFIELITEMQYVLYKAWY